MGHFEQQELEELRRRINRLHVEMGALREAQQEWMMLLSKLLGEYDGKQGDG